MLWITLVALLVQGAVSAAADALKYPVSPERQQANAARVDADLKAAPGTWKEAPLVYYEVTAISPIMRLPDSYPDDGHFLAPLQWIAAQGEFEPASFVVYPLRKVGKLELKAGDLACGNATIPASAIDLKIVKVWYQAGSGWYGYFKDPTRRVPIPELLLNDETLIRVDHATQDNYVRYACADGSQKYAWMSFLSSAVNHEYRLGQANADLISDSPALMPAALEPGEFKQFFATLAVPEKATPGLYKGGITLTADGKPVGTIPVVLRVLPFQLPTPATYYDLNKEFYAAISCQPFPVDHPKALQDLRNHNVLYPGVPSYVPDKPEAFAHMIEQLKAAGLSTRLLANAGAKANIVTDNPPTPEQQAQLDMVRQDERDVVAEAGRLTGQKGNVFSYGIDEAGPATIARERAVWRVIHEEGGKITISAFGHGRLLYNVDYLHLPGMPVERRKKTVDLWHDANPNALIAWYANPHSGPENPDYFRRVHGMMTYKADYDAISNYVWYRNDWNDFWVPAESGLRGLMTVYPTRDSVIDTLEWEGVREGLDDIRYATKLKQIATQAMQSPSVDAQYAGRNALSWLAYWDETREDLAAGRLEMIRYILALDATLKGGRP